MYIRIAFSIELRLRVSRSLRSLANKSGPIQVELTYSSIIAIVILLNTKHNKTPHAYFKGCE